VGRKSKVLEYSVYGTPWPLSETYFLVSRERNIYLQDDKGNRDLIVESPGPKAFRAMDPIPVVPRKRPPIIPTQTFEGERESPTAPMATIGVMNVFISDMEWHKDYKKIKELRIIQIFPKSTPIGDKPKLGYAKQGIARMSLGTVPVEDDGSVYFEAPVDKEIYFQLLDDEGMAVHSMRSGTFVHKGEQLTCIGCHEKKWEAIPPIPNPKAFQRLPSKIKPETSVGVEPLNFYRWVKPVFDKHCTGCHREKKKNPDFSYKSLEPYSWYQFAGGNGDIVLKIKGGTRSIPGRFGAHFSKLGSGGYLTGDHHGVNLSKDDKRRITLWLDLNSYELGANIHEKKQKNGELVWPTFDVDPSNPLGVEIGKTPVIPYPKIKHSKADAFSVHYQRGFLSLNFDFPGNYTVELFNISGKSLYKTHLNQSKSAILPVPGLKSGVYFISIKGRSKKIKKIMPIL
jgi:hypothetical protein